ncbi:FUSC family protein, partial [Thermodesulfobacteriota bacterium]
VATSEAIMEFRTDFLKVLSGIRRALVGDDGSEGSTTAQLQTHSQLNSLFADARSEGTLTGQQKALYGKIVARLEDLRSITSRLAGHRIPPATVPTEAQQDLESVELETGKLLAELAHGISASVDGKVSTTALEKIIDQCARKLRSWPNNGEDVAVSIDHNAACQSFVSTLREIPRCLKDIANSIYGLRTKTATTELQKQDSKRNSSLFEHFTHPDPMSVTGSLRIAITVIAVVVLAWGLQWKSAVASVCFASFVGGGLIYTAGLTLEGGRLEAMAWALGFVVAGVVGAFLTVFAFPNMDRLPSLLILFFVLFFSCGYFASGGGAAGGILVTSSIALVLMLIGSAEKNIDLESIWHMVTSVLFGLAVAVVIQHLMWPTRAFSALRSKLGEAMEKLGDYYRMSLESERPISEGKRLGDLAKNLDYQRVLWGQASRDTHDLQIAAFPITEIFSIEQRLADSVAAVGRLGLSGPARLACGRNAFFDILDQAILAEMRSLEKELRTGKIGSNYAEGLDQGIQDALSRLAVLKKNSANQHDFSEETFRVLEILYYTKKAIAEDLKQLAAALRTPAPMADQ